jgi:hypothetical protein
MAIGFSAILTAIRAAVENSAGYNLTVPAGRFAGDLYASLEPDGQSLRALVTPRIEARITRIAPLSSSPLEEYPLVRYLVEFEILVVRHGNDTHRLIDATRDDIKALAAQDADVLCQTLENPLGGSLGWAYGTDLVSQRLEYISSDVSDFELGDDGGGLIRTSHLFSGIVQVAA